MKECAIGIEHKKMRVANDFGVLRKERFVWLILCVSHFHEQEVLSKGRTYGLAFLDEAGKQFAPTAPFAANLLLSNEVHFWTATRFSRAAE